MMDAMTGQTVRRGSRGGTWAWVAAVLGFVLLAVAAVVQAASAQVLDPLGPFPSGRSVVVLEPGSYLVFEVRKPPDVDEPGRDLDPVVVLGPDGRELVGRDEEQVSPAAARDWAEHVLVGEVDVAVAGEHVVVNGGSVPVALSPSRTPVPVLVAFLLGALLLVVGAVGLARHARRGASDAAPAT
jgi:uncharacterized integral membrane protein